MAPLYTRTIDRPSGNVYINPNTGVPTQIVPAGGLTDTGLWVPLKLNADGTISATVTENQGTPHYDDAVATTTPGVEQTLIGQTVAAGNTRYLYQVILATRVTGIFEIFSNGDLIGSGRTGPGCVPVVTFLPARPVMENILYEVKFTSRLNSSAQSVECYVQAADVPQ